MIHRLSEDHEWIKYSAFYNVYPIRDEIGAGATATPQQLSPYGDFYCDDYYGRFFDKESNSVAPKYGLSSKMRPYVPIRVLNLVEELRVPYRKIPVYETNSLQVLQMVLAELRAKNNGYDILMRGQTKTYFLDRDPEECFHFYGEESVREPSFLPSHLRKNFNVHFLKCMWQSQAAILCNDIAYDLAHSPAGSDPDGFWHRLTEFRHSPGFVLFALGIAQHYGLPSVGLDLTDSIEVACWFATHAIATSESGKASTSPIQFSAAETPTIFFFRCPPDAVFDYRLVKPAGFPDGRPDRQSAWFGHVGWGAASNQLGSYLMCGFRLTPDVVNELDPRLDEKLFPGSSDDAVLKHFLTMRELQKYEGEARRALQGIYFMR